MLYIWIILGTKLQLKLTVLVFWTKFISKKGSSKTEEVNITIEFYILALIYLPNFDLNWQF